MLRGIQTVELMLGLPGTKDFLHKKYELPDPYTLEEYTDALDDLQDRWDAGERTPIGNAPTPERLHSIDVSGQIEAVISELQRARSLSDDETTEEIITEQITALNDVKSAIVTGGDIEE